MRKSSLFRSILNVVLITALSMSLVPLPQNVSTQESYLAPRAFSKTPEALIDYVTFTSSSLITAGVSAPNILAQLEGATSDTAIGSVKRSISELKELGIRVQMIVIAQDVLELRFNGVMFEKRLVVNRFGVDEKVEKSYRFTALVRSVQQLVSVFYRSMRDPLLYQYEKLRPKLQKILDSVFPAKREVDLERRMALRLGAFSGVAVLLTLAGCDVAFKDGQIQFGRPDKDDEPFPGVTGDPVILEIEKDFSKGTPVNLKDNQTSDTSFTMLAQVNSVDPTNAPAFFEVTAFTQTGAQVVLNPFQPIESGRTIDDTIPQGFPILTPGVPQPISFRAFLVREPSQAGENFSNLIDPNKFSASKFRPMRAGDQLTFRLRVFEGSSVNNPRFSTSGPNNIKEFRFPQPVTIQEPVTLIRNAQNNPEPGTLSQVIQNPLSVTNDGTLRLTFKTDIPDSANIKPGFVLVTLFNDQTNEFLNSFFEPISNPSGVNEVDIQATRFNFTTQQVEPIPTNTPLRVVIQNAGLGLTPADAKQESIKTLNFVRDSNPVSLRQAQLVKNASNDSVEIVGGTRLLKLRINGSSQTNDLLTPEFHFLRFRLFNFASRTNPNLPQTVEFSTTVQIPLITQNGVSVPLSNQPQDYFVEIPAALLPVLNQSTLQSVEVFNVRRGYKAVSTGVVNLADMANQRNNVFTSADALSSTPAVTNISAQEDVVTLTIEANPSGGANDVRVTGHNVTFNLVNTNNGEAISTTQFVALPTRLTDVNGQVVEVPQNNVAQTFQLKLTDPSVVAFLANGSATIQSISVNNASTQVPGGPVATVASNVTVFAVAAQVTEVPLISGITGSPNNLGDTAINVTLQADGPQGSTGGSTPNKLRFTISLFNPNGERYQIVQDQNLTGNHLTNRTQSEVYSLTLEDARITTGTIVEDVSVQNIDINLNTSQVDMFQGNVMIDPQRVSQAPTITSLQGAGTLEAQIEFNIPTQAIDGAALTYPNSRPNVIVEAFTASGKQFPPTGTIVIKDTDVTLVSPGVGRVNFDFSQFGAFTQTDTVFFTLRSAPPQSAFSVRSATSSGSYLVAALDRAVIERGGRRWRREAFSGARLAQSETALGAVVALGFVSDQRMEQGSNELDLLIEEEVAAYLDLEGGVPSIPKNEFSQILLRALKRSSIYESVSSDGLSDEVLLELFLRQHIEQLNKSSQLSFGKSVIEITSSPSPFVLETSL